MSNVVALMVLLGGLTLLGLLVVVPIVAILSEARAKGGRGAQGREVEALQERVRSLEARVEDQERRLAELKEVLEVNVLSLEEGRALAQRLGSPSGTD
ncbi:MAG: hypothetical protein ACK41F_06775 [Fimbriimonadaceae bacterium]